MHDGKPASSRCLKSIDLPNSCRQRSSWAPSAHLLAEIRGLQLWAAGSPQPGIDAGTWAGLVGAEREVVPVLLPAAVGAAWPDQAVPNLHGPSL